MSRQRTSSAVAREPAFGWWLPFAAAVLVLTAIVARDLASHASLIESAIGLRRGYDVHEVEPCDGLWVPAMAMHAVGLLPIELCQPAPRFCVLRYPRWCFAGWCQMNGTSVRMAYGQVTARTGNVSCRVNHRGELEY